MFDLIENLLGTCVNTELRAKADAILTKRGGDLKAFDDRLWATRMARATPAPDFELNDLDGKPVKLSDFGGKVLLLNFFFPT
ncbi:MAG: redoxin domain-containing protein [bacterium]|nr:redoxin domain-containing protein [bacterium]